ncbi:uncharacterized protein LOC109806017 [Cajanus cajan]|uniref:DUF1262 family protein n=1 Tax=Cajanus cajan TaxID=3821 RepID=A0A151SZQ8_CAJCA|nr:uncharacterized protein LOC109806017 [Cajanus cajan]KYP60286.1 hypothetical protein KK1_015739 [Cajanus cajan]
MYVTRPISMYKSNPGALSEPPFGPNSGYLVIWDLPPTYTCFGLCEDPRIKHLPFPQDKNLTTTYTTSSGESTDTHRDKVLFIPVLNQPLSSNCYYVIRRQGKHQGQASTSSKEEDKTTCLCCSFVKDVKPRALAPSDDYQQVEIIKKRHGFQAKSVAPDGIPPRFLRTKGWNVEARTPRNYQLHEALGPNDSLRSKLPHFNFSVSNGSSESVEVGKWYCPFMFLKEGMGLKEQMKMSMFYEVTLVQRWEKIFSKENENSGEDTVLVDVAIQTEVVKVAGRDAVWDENGVVEGILWFRSFGDDGREMRVGLSLEVVGRMKWEQERVGWKASDGRQESVVRVEEFRGTNKWERFGCYVLVESFVFRRMDRGLVLTYDFKHTHQIMCKWE